LKVHNWLQSIHADCRRRGDPKEVADPIRPKGGGGIGDRRGKPKELLHHSDQGSQYTSEQFQQLMADSGIVCSMSRFGNVWDNAAMESFFSSLKTERVLRAMK
jgi:transposase InsO family protein